MGESMRHGIGGVARIHPSIEPSSDGRVDETARASGHDDVSANLSLVSAVSGGVTHVNESRDRPDKNDTTLKDGKHMAYLSPGIPM